MADLKCMICGAVVGQGDYESTDYICGNHTPAEKEAFIDQRDGIFADKARFLVLYNAGQDALIAWDGLTQAQKNAVMKGMLEFNLLSVKLIRFILQGRIR